MANAPIGSDQISDAELRARFANTEDPFVERKVHKDAKDWLKTAIAFANSLPNGMAGVMFVPAFDNGTVQQGVDLDQLQRDISDRLVNAYPDLYYFQRIVDVPGGSVVAVVVPGSAARPHFSGHAFIRDGSKSVKASADQFAVLIARRSSVVEELHRWMDRPVSMHWLRPHFMGGPRVINVYEAEILSCNQHWLTVRFADGPAKTTESYTLSRVQLSFDQKYERLVVEVET
jgi:hypothetical protein